MLGLSLSIWGAAWALIWIRRASHEESDAQTLIQEPIIFVLALGLIALVTFSCVLLMRPDDGIRSAIAGSFILVFLLMMIALPVVPEFLGTLIAAPGEGQSIPEAEAAARANVARAQHIATFFASLFETFKWAITAVIGFYFAATASERVTERIQAGRAKRSGDERAKAEAELEMEKLRRSTT